MKSPYGECGHSPTGQRIDHVMFGASGTANASGLSRFRRLRGLMRRFNSSSQLMHFSVIAAHSPVSQWDKRVCGSTDGPAHCADAGNIAQTPGLPGGRQPN
jgi:hypothetical protein